MATKALGFVRVSTGSQDAQTQETQIREHCAKHKITLVDIMTPPTRAASASKGEQLPELQALIGRIARGDADSVIVTDSSRLDRRENLDDQVRTMFAIKDAGGTIVSLDPGEAAFATSDFVGWQSTITKMYVSAEKSRVVKEQTWRGAQAIMANKAVFGPLPPYWRAVGPRYERVATCTDPEAVRTIYRAIANGQSMSSVAREFDTYPQTVRRLVRNEANKTGTFQCHYTHAGQTHTWKHQAVGKPPVDKELWRSANDVLDEIQETGRANLGGRPVQLAKSWISGLLTCPECGGRLSTLRGKSLRCTGRGKDRRSCGVSGIDLATVLREVEEAITDEPTRVYRYRRVRGNQAERDELTDELERVRQALATTDDDDEFDQLSARRKELREAIGSFVLVPDTYDMEPTDDTLSDLWRTGDKRKIMQALMRYVSFDVGFSREYPEVNGWVFMHGYYPGETLIEITDDTCIKLDVSLRQKHRAR